jgi:uncharacterized protein (TIGR04255 family)
MKLPKRISPCSIIDSVIELRFESLFPTDAIFGVVFSTVKNEYPKFQKLPVSEVPGIIRDQDPNLKHAAYYQAVSLPFIFRLGPHVVSLSNNGEYVGWDKFFLKLKGLLENLEKTGVVSKFTRLGLRYIDFFEKDIYENVNLSISDIQVDNKPLPFKQKVFRALVENDKFLTNIQIVNNTTIKIKGNAKTGSLIDSDTSFELPAGFNFTGLHELIEGCHLREKEIFFSLLKDEFIQTLNPEY